MRATTAAVKASQNASAVDTPEAAARSSLRQPTGLPEHLLASQDATPLSRMAASTSTPLAALWGSNSRLSTTLNQSGTPAAAAFEQEAALSDQLRAENARCVSCWLNSALQGAHALLPLP